MEHVVQIPYKGGVDKRLRCGDRSSSCRRIKPFYSVLLQRNKPLCSILDVSEEKIFLSDPSVEGRVGHLQRPYTVMEGLRGGEKKTSALKMHHLSTGWGWMLGL